MRKPKPQPHLHVWGIPSFKTRVKLGSMYIYYSECVICGKLKMFGGMP